jgi:hypothetical protein
MILSWILIVLGVLIGTAGLIKLTPRRAKPEMAKPGARSDSWSYVRIGLIIIAVGVATLGEEAKNDTAELAGRWAAGALAGLTLGLLLRARMRGKRTGKTTEVLNRPCRGPRWSHLR